MQFRFIHEVSSPEAVEAAVECGARNLLTPSHAPANQLRRLARALGMRAAIFVAVPPADHEALDEALDAFGLDLPDGVLLADCRGRADLQRLSAKLAVREALANRPEGAIGILAGAGQSAAGVMALPDFAGGVRRLAGFVHDPETLARAIGTDPAAPTLKTAQSLVVFAAAAAQAPAFFVLSPLMDPAALGRRCAQARRAGFAGVVLKTPAQFAAAREDPGMIDKRP